VPQQNVSGLRVTDIVVDGQKMQFAAPDVPNSPKFELTFSADKMSGTFTVRETSMAVELKRTGEAKVDIDAPSPAVSKELEGDWDGAMTLPTAEKSRALTVHFKNQPDQTVVATIDSPGRGIKGVLLSGVKQNGAAVEFFVRVGGTFKGTLNKDGTELTGEWRQNATAAPLPVSLKKR
jgi:hypothetical protein